MILYIGNKHCTSLAELKGYFSEDLTPESDIYADLLDFGRHGDIAAWLREMGELELASRADSISTDLSDSTFYSQLKAAITGSPIEPNTQLKPPFDRCFSFEGIKCDVKENEAKVFISLKVLMCVKEEYELSASSNWGMRGMIINPHSHPEGKTACFAFTFRKRPGKDFGEITIKADGTALLLDKPVKNNTSTEEFKVNGGTFKMILVEGGKFQMGEGSDRHEVELSRYFIGETVVTQELWEAIMGTNPSLYKGRDLPVEFVCWNDSYKKEYSCKEFIRRLNKATGKKFRLPTEAEWEFAARGGNKEKDKNYKYSGSNSLNDVGWYKHRNIKAHIHPVKKKTPNGLGIYDMSGNVWEWCVDWYWHDYDSRKKNPKGPSSGFYRVNRGGSWSSSAGQCLVAHRHKSAPDSRSHNRGFRLALSK